MDGSRLDGFVLSSRGRKRLPTQFLPPSMACRTPTGTPNSPILRGVYSLCAGVHKGLDLRKLRSTCPGSPHRMPAGVGLNPAANRAYVDAELGSLGGVAVAQRAAVIELCARSPAPANSLFPDRYPVRTSRTCAALSRTSSSLFFGRLDNTTAAGTVWSVDSGPKVSISRRTRVPLRSSTTHIPHTELGPRRTTSVPQMVGIHSLTSCSPPSYITRVPTPIRTPAPLTTNSVTSESMSKTRPPTGQ